MQGDLFGSWSRPNELQIDILLSSINEEARKGGKKPKDGEMGASVVMNSRAVVCVSIVLRMCRESKECRCEVEYEAKKKGPSHCGHI